MRILTILGSPRRHGNTAAVLFWIEERLSARGHESERLSIRDFRVEGCTGCMDCKETPAEFCTIKDDAEDIFRRMIAADMVLFTAPVYCWGFPAQIKALIDRMFCLMDTDGDRPQALRLAGKPIGLLLTAGGDEKENIDLVLRGFEQFVEYIRGRLVGHLAIANCTTPDALRDDVAEQASSFADLLADALPPTTPPNGGEWTDDT